MQRGAMTAGTAGAGRLSCASGHDGCAVGGGHNGSKAKAHPAEGSGEAIPAGDRSISRSRSSPSRSADTFDLPPIELADDLVAAKEWTRLAPMLRAARQVTVAERGC